MEKSQMELEIFEYLSKLKEESKLNLVQLVSIQVSFANTFYLLNKFLEENQAKATKKG